MGLIASLREEFGWALEDLELPEKCDRHVTVVTGTAAFETLKKLTADLCAAVKGLRVDVVAVKNEFFGESVTVAGLLTGQDMAAQLRGRELGNAVLIPSVSLRAGEDAVFLDDKTPKWLSEQLCTPVVAVDNDGEKLVRAVLGI